VPEEVTTESSLTVYDKIDYIIDTAYSDDKEKRNAMRNYFAAVLGEYDGPTLTSGGKEYTLIKKAPDNDMFAFLISHSAVIGNEVAGYSPNDHSIYVPHGQDAEAAKLQISALYEVMLSAESAMVGMTDMEKANYIFRTIKNDYTLKEHNFFAGETAITKIGSCGAISVIAELMGRAAGLDISSESGDSISSGTGHEWDVIFIDGHRYIMDIPYGKMLIEPEEYYQTIATAGY